MPTSKKEKQSFKEAFAELEKIVELFEKGDMDLDESLAHFERGLELATLCKQRLAVIENKVKSIKEKFSDLTANGTEDDNL